MEVLISVAVIGVLAALLVPAANRLVDNARQAGCANNLRQIHVALMAYAGDNKGFLPLAINEVDGSTTWLGYLQNGGYAPDVRATETPSRYFIFCPGSKVRTDQKKAHLAYSNYGLNRQIAGRIKLNGANTPSVPLGAIAAPSKKLLVLDSGAYENYSSLETAPGSGNFYIPGLPANKGVAWEDRFKEDAIEGRHAGKLNVLMVDGHVESSVARDFSGGDAWLNK